MLCRKIVLLAIDRPESIEGDVGRYEGQEHDPDCRATVAHASTAILFHQLAPADTKGEQPLGA